MKRFSDRIYTVENGIRVKKTRFPLSMFWVCLGFICGIAGLNMCMIVVMRSLHISPLAQVHLMLLFLVLMAVCMTLHIRKKMKHTYELPLQRISEATRKVAQGDFSVYIPATHTPERYDYLDLMILDLNRMIEELGSIETLKTDFFSNVSHEIKTPLAVIQSNVDLLERPGRTEEEARECTKNIHQATRRLSDLISNMLRLNKLETQTIRPAPERYDLCRQLCGCALQFENIWDEKNIEFEAGLEDEAYIEADEGLLELVWNNLLSNALKFTPPGGTVRLEQKQRGGKIQVAVTDTGCGMSGETLRHIFDKFYQGDTSHAAEGNGLGLALVKRVLELSEGTISVESREGEGSTFTVTLPAERTDAETEVNADDGQ